MHYSFNVNQCDESPFPTKPRRQRMRKGVDKLPGLTTKQFLLYSAAVYVLCFVLIIVLQLFLLVQRENDPAPLLIEGNSPRNLERENFPLENDPDSLLIEGNSPRNLRRANDQTDMKWQCTEVECGAKKLGQRDACVYKLGSQLTGNRSERLLVSGDEEALLDVLMDGAEMRGAFDIVKPPGKTVMVYSSDDKFTIESEMGPPLWLVVRQSAKVKVHVAVEGTADGSSACPIIGLNPGERLSSELQSSFQKITEKMSQPERRPFFKKRKKASRATDLVTVCVQLTVDRLLRLASIAENWAGPVSAAIFVGRYSSVDDEIRKVAAAWEKSQAMQNYVDIHLVIDSKKPWFEVGKDARGDDPYPVNLLRQESINRAETDWIFLSEGDMVSLPNGHEIVHKSWDRMLSIEKKILQHGGGSSAGVVFVVPLYDMPTNDQNLFRKATLSQRVPGSKSELSGAVKQGKVSRMSDTYHSHSHLDYSAWEELGDRDEFLAYSWSEGAEPYYISRKKNLPPFDPLYMGIHKDKVSWVTDIGKMGFTFKVHPQLYAVNFGSDGVGESWITLRSNGMKSYVWLMHDVFFSEWTERHTKTKISL